MAKGKRRKTELTDYDNPPVVEVVYGVKFKPLENWLIPHVGAFWQRVANEFPRCQHAAPIGDPGVEPMELFLPRVWLISDSDDLLVQLQSGRFLFNWRYREEVGPYPRYKKLSKRFFELFARFQEFVAEHGFPDLEFQEFELTYINHVYEPDGWSFPEQLNEVVGLFDLGKLRFQYLPSPTIINWQARFPFEEQSGRLVVKLQPGRHEGREVILLEMSARGLPAEPAIDHMENWFSDAHEWIVRGFDDLTTETAQRELWGKHD